MKIQTLAAEIFCRIECQSFRLTSAAMYTKTACFDSHERGSNSGLSVANNANSLRGKTFRTES